MRELWMNSQFPLGNNIDLNSFMDRHVVDGSDCGWRSEFRATTKRREEAREFCIKMIRRICSVEVCPTTLRRLPSIPSTADSSIFIYVLVLLGLFYESMKGMVSSDSYISSTFSWFSDIILF